MKNQIIGAAESKMIASVGAIKREFAGVRTGRASPALLDGIRVPYYGSQVPLNQVASVGAPDPKTLTIQPWDGNLLAEIEKAIQKSDLGLTPRNDGNQIYLPIPPLTEERRKVLIKVAKRMAEDHRIAIRNIRRDANDTLRKQEKAGALSEDESKRLQKEVQELTDRYVTQVDEALERKEQEIMEV